MPLIGTSASQNTKSFLTVPVDFLVVAGGGAGGQNNGGGGGAGGLRSSVTATGGGGTLESSLSLLRSTPYTVTVGAGGATGYIVGEANTVSTSGSNSVFSTITSIGGGKGGDYSSVDNSETGGSGGGKAPNGTYMSSPFSPVTNGTANQGFAGGLGGYNGGGYENRRSAGGGGGAGLAGGGTGTSAYSGNGGDGVATSITGSSVTYAGGGGGGADTNIAGAGSGGSGGGGAGGRGDVGTNGSANTGGGGGGGGNRSGVPDWFAGGGLGGSGVVILRVNQIATATSGSPVYTTSGSYHIYKFNASGSITF
jgi:hypothetical protein